MNPGFQHSLIALQALYTRRAVFLLLLLTGPRLTVRQLAKLESLAIYFDTDATSLAGLSHAEFVEKFAALVS